jgi:hypothetical protein
MLPRGDLIFLTAGKLQISGLKTSSGAHSFKEVIADGQRLNKLTGTRIKGRLSLRNDAKSQSHPNRVSQVPSSG